MLSAHRVELIARKMGQTPACERFQCVATRRTIEQQVEPMGVEPTTF
ncbi:MAG TPA: hypothetical protein PKD54_12570 [Pirellulaceae bacterium]|nr:hypothetical protein [Pirellulaceae bacterium]